MSLFYALAYRLGFVPWEHAATHPPAARHIEALFAREEGDRRPPYGRALDLGCGLTRAQRRAVGRDVDAIATGDATVLMLAWAPGRRGPLPRGMSREDVEDAFGGWRITEEEPFDATGLPGPLRNVDPRVYRLRRA